MKFADVAKQEYDKLLKELSEKEHEVKSVRDKIKPFKLFLEEAGIIKKQTRNRNGSPKA